LRRCAERLAERRENEDFLDGFGGIGHHRGLLLMFSRPPVSTFRDVDEIVLVLAPLRVVKKG
jgi:hypothetical protein